MFNDFLTQFWPATVDGLSLGAIYALLALGYTMVYGVLRLINFAHSEIFMIGTFASLAVVNLFGFSGVGGFTLVGVVLVLAVAGGLANIAVPRDQLDAAAQDLASAILAAPRDAVIETKALLQGAQGRTYDEQRAAERQAQARRLRDLAGLGD